MNKIPNNNNLTSKTLHFFIALTVATLTTGFLRLQLFTGLPETDGGFYTFINQYIYHTLSNGQDIKGISIHLYQLMTYWVHGLDVHQLIVLRLIDVLVAIIASIIFFKVILKESGSLLFTVILMIPLLILMNDIEVIGFGFRNSYWVAYIPLFTALLVWQKSSKEDAFSFYLIGALVSLGILFREQCLPFFLFAGITIWIGYGWRVLLKYLIGSAILGFSVLAVVLSLRGWDLLDLINSYLFHRNSQTYMVGGLSDYSNITSKMFINSGLKSLKANWFICITALASIIYLIKPYATGLLAPVYALNNVDIEYSDYKKRIRMSRVYFWLLMALMGLTQQLFTPTMFEYHFAQCLPGLVGLSAMGWRYINSNESKRVNTSSLLILGLMSLIVIMPTVNRTVIKSNFIYTPSVAIERITMLDSFRGKQTIERSQYLTIAAKIYELSREDSTLVVSGWMQALYPLTGLLPPKIEINSLSGLYSNLDLDEARLINAIKKERPTIIVTLNLPPMSTPRNESDLPAIIEKTNLYNKVVVVPTNLAINYGWKSAIIYRLKDFK